MSFWLISAAAANLSESNCAKDLVNSLFLHSQSSLGRQFNTTGERLGVEPTALSTFRYGDITSATPQVWVIVTENSLTKISNRYIWLDWGTYPGPPDLQLVDQRSSRNYYIDRVGQVLDKFFTIQTIITP